MVKKKQRKKPSTLKAKRQSKRRLYRFLNAIGSTAKIRKIGGRIERLETAIEANNGKAEELKEALRTTVRRYWGKCPAGMD